MNGLSLTEAKTLIVEAQAWFTGVSISPVKQALWAEALVDVPGLRVVDVRKALRAIASREKPSGEFWSLEIAEILAVSKAEMRRRREREGQDLSRPAIAARSQPHPDDARRAELARQVLRDLMKQMEMKKLENLNNRAAADARRAELWAQAQVIMEDDLIEKQKAEARRAELSEQAQRLEREAKEHK